MNVLFVDINRFSYLPVWYDLFSELHCFLKMFSLYICIFLLPMVMTSAQLTSDVDELLNWCIDSKHHKSKPGPESSLFGQCTPWKNRSCCTEEITQKIHDQVLYDFNFDHCKEKQPLSKECRKHFIQDHCFYECSPNGGPWTVKEARTWRKERYYKMPLCASDCLSWFNDCFRDYTCTDNWSTNFEWVTEKNCPAGKQCKQNICPTGSTCQTFAEIYGSAEKFCETVWDGTWDYTEDDQPCMRLWFNSTFGNPNDGVARWKADSLSGGDSLYSRTSLVCLSIFSLVYLLIL